MPRGRPKKKGKSSWAPANRLTVANKQEDFRYRFVDQDAMNVQRKQAEGWQFVNRSTGIPGEHIRPGHVGDDTPIDGAMTYRDLVVMGLPEELAQERDAWVAERTDQQERDIVKNLKRQAEDAGGSVSPKLVIE